MVRHLLALVLIVFLAGSAGSAQKNETSAFDAKDVATANTLVETMQIPDWLGPMAPIALSPFFGVTVLSGLALYGPQWAADNALLGASGPLQNQTLFIVFLVLTLLTSLPRLSKVSKPIAQALDQVETYSVIIIILAIKFLNTPGDATTPVAMVQLGVFSVTVDVLLSLAMVVNIIVINTVRFFFEILVWLTPIPALDAIFEVCNKTLCAVLMTIYAFSPTLATILNIVILLTAAVIFRWVSRQVRFYRTMAADPLITIVWPGYGRPRPPQLVVFPTEVIGPFQPKSHLKFSRVENGWQLESAGWFSPSVTYVIAEGACPTIRRGWLMHSLDLMVGCDIKSLNLSRRYDASLPDLTEQLGVDLIKSEPARDGAAPEIAGDVG